MTAVAPWTFATPPAQPRNPQVVLFVFGTKRLNTDEVLSKSRYGIASDAAVDSCHVQTIARARDRAWFDAFRSGSTRNIAADDLGAAIAQLDAADHVHVIRSEPRGPADLTYLQAAWGIARWMTAQGATVVLDAMALTFWPAAKLQAAGEPLDTRREVRVIYETDSTRPDGAHAIHTRGLRKFGAPDLVALITDADVALVGEAIAELAEKVARGTDLATPAHALEVAPGVRWVVVEDEHRLAEILQLNNSARVIVDATGHDLMGVAKRAATPAS